MTMDSEAKNYELAYLLSPSLPEEEVLGYSGKLSGIVEEQKGAIRRVEPPKRRTLAYPIQKERSAYFGWTTFAADPSAVARIEKNVKETPQILRHLIVEEEIETKRPFFLRPLKPRTAAGAAKAAVPEAREKPEEKLDLEALDKKLEEILGE